MSYKKNRRPSLPDWERVQTLTGASTGTAISNHGLTVITVTTGEGTAANLTYTMDSPGYAGKRKTILADLNSTKEVTVRTASSAGTFYGSTKNSITFATGSTKTATVAELVSFSSVRWAVLNLGAPLAAVAVTGSTATAAVTYKASIAGATA